MEEKEYKRGMNNIHEQVGGWKDAHFLYWDEPQRPNEIVVCGTCGEVVTTNGGCAICPQCGTHTCSGE